MLLQVLLKETWCWWNQVP